MSSESASERDDSDEEILSFDLGPEPYDPLVQERLPSAEWLDDLQQRLIPPDSEPKVMEYDPEAHEMPVRPSLIDTMRRDMAPKVDAWDTAPMSAERESTPTIGFSYDYMMDAPPTIQRIAEAPTHAAHTQTRLGYALTLVQPCSLHDRVPRRSHRLRLR